MKNAILVCLFAAASLSAQESGAAGKLLQNENPKVDFQNKKELENYVWNPIFDQGYSEVFIRIPEKGYYTIQLGEQSISTNSGYFRFFDLPSVKQTLSIWAGKQLLYQVSILPENQTRLLLDFFYSKGLFLLGEQDLVALHDSYYGENWATIWNDYYNGALNQNFVKFLETFKKQSFDNNKLKFFVMQKKHVLFTTHQIAELMKNMSFDDARLQLAMEAYGNVIDKENYYMLTEVFAFRSNADKLIEFIRK